MPATRTVSPLALAFAWLGALLFVICLLYFAYSYVVRYGETAGGGSTLRAVGINVLLFGAFAAHHSLLARTSIKRRLQRIVPAPLERSLYTWAASLLFIVTCALWQPVPGRIYRLDGLWAAAGYLVQMLGVVMTLGAARAIDVLDLAGVRPGLDATTGRAPRHVPLETRGAYGLVRHPLYLAWSLLVFGAPDMTGTRFAFAVISTAYLALAIPYEERTLLGTFGAEYRAYQARVRWRMLPGIY
jgi:protein-S-isoprenylcysteine O-methyltransferase Ste14